MAMKNVQNTTLVDLVAALGHDLRSSLSSASLASGLMATHPDEEVQGFAERLARTVQRQTELLDLVGGLVDSFSDETSITLKQFAALLRGRGVEVRGAISQRSIRNGTLISAALSHLLRGSAVEVVLGSGVVRLATDVDHRASGARSTPHVILAACGVRIEANDGGSCFILEA